VNEAAVRDYLAEHLDLVEPGLTLLGSEFPLPNRDGAKGFIDIFAKDRYGHLVVIELKISIATSRTAMHELHKYIGLLRREYGFAPHKLRCIVLSTDWHELRVPFSEFSSSVEYPAIGKLVVLDDAGIPIRLEQIVTLKEPDQVALCPETLILLYAGSTASERDRCMDELVARAASLAILDYCLLPIDNPTNDNVPFGIYVAIAKLSASDRTRLGALPEFPIDDYLSDDDEWAFEQAALDLLTSETFRSELETGNPHKLGSVLGAQGWKPGLMRRGGRYKNAALLTDNELLQQLTGIAGESDVWYGCFTSPQHDASWQHAIQSAQRSLSGNDVWTTAFLWFMERTKRELPTSSVSVSLFNPQCTAKILWRMPIERELDVLPQLEIVVEQEHGKRSLVLKGEIEWDGVTCPTDPESSFHNAFENAFGIPFTLRQFGLMLITGNLRDMDKSIMAAHGLRYAVTEHILEQGEATVRRLAVIDGLVKESTTPRVSFSQFFAVNQKYTHDIDRMLAPMGYLNLI